MCALSTLGDGSPRCDSPWMLYPDHLPKGLHGLKLLTLNDTVYAFGKFLISSLIICIELKKLFTGGSDTFSEENSDNQNVIYKMDSFTYNFNAISYMIRRRSYFGLSKIQVTDDVCN